MMNPLDAPENLPSVIRHVELPRPAPIMAPVGPENPKLFVPFMSLREGTYQAAREGREHKLKDAEYELSHLRHPGGPLWS